MVLGYGWIKGAKLICGSENEHVKLRGSNRSCFPVAVTSIVL